MKLLNLVEKRLAALREYRALNVKLRFLQLKCHTCLDCGQHVGSYMLEDKLWNELVPECIELKKELDHQITYPDIPHFVGTVAVCIKCVEKRAGRELTADDFKRGLPCNDAIFMLLERTKK